MSASIEIVTTLSAVTVGLITLVSSFTNRQISEKTQKTLEDRINTYKKELEEYEENLEKKPKIAAKGDINILTYTSPNKNKLEFALLENEDIMNIHQKQALMHSRVQFYTGIIISIIGFIFFVYILFVSLETSNNIALGIKLTSSLIFEAIAVLFLKESHKLRESSKEYHDNLRENLKQQEAIQIAEAIQNEEIRSIIQAQLALHMIGIKSETIDITKILDSNNKVS
ncbi:hypothetical protein [Bacillus cereus group sp. N3]|uniref:hypothetical protein n=1 Tax=Bacillus cereus group sp. N3 TaxID=2794582 RepID=UPI0018F4A94F|nr:hypothetical protein [Bacillus cereus group sp. N3]MBJ8128923.1 hypothetical protein [Bacillus cereus group sp. N3]